jgi:hypothetical protein
LAVRWNFVQSELPEVRMQPAGPLPEACSRSAEPVSASLTEQSISVEARESQPERPPSALQVFQPVRRVLPAVEVEQLVAAALLAVRRLPLACR